MLRVVNGKITDSRGRRIVLRGLNLGGWLMMEGYILGGRNIPESAFKAELARLFGKNFIPEFSTRFRASFFGEQDCVVIKDIGFNCIRLPFNYRLLEEPGGLDYLESAVKMLAKHELYVILDMHAAPGSQNCDWHSDSSGKALFWENVKSQEKYYALWEKLALIFKNEPWLAGYDIMNEPVTEDISLLANVYQRAIDTIRSVGDRHLIFLEGNKWGQEIDFIVSLKGDNLALSIHFYEPAGFVFNWRAGVDYPGLIDGIKWGKAEIMRRLKVYADFAHKLKRPVFVGEFGLASRCDRCGEEFRWVKDMLEVFNELDFHWAYWTYKSVKGMDFPDGLYQLSGHHDLIGTRSLCSGLEYFYGILKREKESFIELWKTDNFTRNRFLARIFEPHLKT